MGIKFPEDLDAWNRWQQRQNLFRYIKNNLTHTTNTEVHEITIYTRESEKTPEILVALELTTPTQIAALLKPALYLEEAGYQIAIASVIDSARYLRQEGFCVSAQCVSAEDAIPTPLKDVTEVIATGNYLPIGDWVYKLADKGNWAFNVVQHGLNTPYAPPLPKNSTLFSFSEEDAEFWKSGRTDIEAHAVGSQLFYEAAQKPAVSQDEVDMSALTFLGQMHGAELPRASFAKSSYDFCQKHSATYRPHPSEKDKISLLTHKLWAKQGIKIDTSGTPLNQSTAPVVSIFSTGVLEAAIRGVPAWVYHSNPPAWLKEFWERYGMNQWGSEPTPAPTQPEIEPALAIANYIAHRLEK